MFLKNLIISAAVLLAVSCSDQVPNSSLKDDVEPIGFDQGIKLVIHGPESRRLANLKEYNIRRIIVMNDKNIIHWNNMSEVPAGSIKAYKIPLQRGKEFNVIQNSERQYYSPQSILVLNGKITNDLVIQHLYLKRIDIDHMLVTRPDGTQYTSKGEVDINVDLNGEWQSIIHTMPTGSGIDVVSGFKYKLIVRAETEDGSETFSKILDYTKSI